MLDWNMVEAALGDPLGDPLPPFFPNLVAMQAHFLNYELYFYGEASETVWKTALYHIRTTGTPTRQRRHRDLVYAADHNDFKSGVDDFFALTLWMGSGKPLDHYAGYLRQLVLRPPETS